MWDQCSLRLKGLKSLHLDMKALMASPCCWIFVDVVWSHVQNSTLVFPLGMIVSIWKSGEDIYVKWKNIELNSKTRIKEKWPKLKLWGQYIWIYFLNNMTTEGKLILHHVKFANQICIPNIFKIEKKCTSDKWSSAVWLRSMDTTKHNLPITVIFTFSLPVLNTTLSVYRNVQGHTPWASLFVLQLRGSNMLDSLTTTGFKG